VHSRATFADNASVFRDVNSPSGDERVIDPFDACAIRPMRREDLSLVVELLMQTSVLDIRPRLVERLTSIESGQVNVALVAEQSGIIVGAAKLTTEPAFPGTASALVAVAEPARGRGIGTDLANILAARFEACEAKSVTCAIRDDLDGGRRFAERLGFAVTNHSVGWRLDLSGSLRELATRAARALEVARVQIRTADLAEERRTIIDCVRRSMAGLPVSRGYVQGFDPGQDTQLIPGGSRIIVAEMRDEPGYACGVTILAPETASGAWHVNFTGVDPRYRGRGVAAALKTASLLSGWQAGARFITAVNDDSNLAIQHLNQELGMKRTAGYWSLAQSLDHIVGEPN
jgi:GNAT superfamily N-acetyltransferase